jgi:hypothetical protein
VPSWSNHGPPSSLGVKVPPSLIVPCCQSGQNLIGFQFHLTSVSPLLFPTHMVSLNINTPNSLAFR